MYYMSHINGVIQNFLKIKNFSSNSEFIKIGGYLPFRVSFEEMNWKFFDLPKPH